MNNGNILERGNLIPNLVKIVKGYAKYEKEIFNEMTSKSLSDSGGDFWGGSGGGGGGYW